MVPKRIAANCQGAMPAPVQYAPQPAAAYAPIVVGAPQIPALLQSTVFVETVGYVDGIAYFILPPMFVGPFFSRASSTSWNAARIKDFSPSASDAIASFASARTGLTLFSVMVGRSFDRGDFDTHQTCHDHSRPIQGLLTFC